ncbi:RNA-directed DNA polymerase, eukaryota, reverse transcriptase zinc-binding domain protein [Tanacetum coccineum]
MTGVSSFKSDPGAWTWVFGKNKNLNAKHIDNPFEKDVDKIATSFFVMNFPESLDAKGLWKEFQPFGRIVDAFIANKRLKIGKRFGFVRFLGVNNADTFVNRLSNIWMGSYHVFVSVAKFQRQNKTDKIPTNKDFLHLKKPNVTQFRNPIGSDKPSFASVASGGGGVNRNQNKVNQDKGNNITLCEHDLITVDDSSTVVLVKVKEVDSISNMYRICRNEGFDDVKIHYVKGLWVWIQFNNAKSCEALKSNKALQNVWATIRAASTSFIVDERMVWIEITDDNMSLGRICIATNKPFTVAETVKVTIRGVTFDAHVKEISTWNTTIENDLECSDSEGSHEDDVLSFNMEENHNKVLDEFIEQVMETKSTFPKNEVQDNVKVGDHEVSNDTGSKPSGFETKINDETIPDVKPYEVEEMMVFNISFGNLKSKDKKGFSFINEMNKMIEVGDALGYDVKGCKRSFRKMINGIGIQETMASKLELFHLKSIWGNFKFDYACSMARGKWLNSTNNYYLINVYGPQHQPDKANLWESLRIFAHQHVGHIILFGDLNEVRHENESFRTTFSSNDALIFNSFIDNSLIPHLHATELDKVWSDHNPIHLHCSWFSRKVATFKISSQALVIFPPIVVGKRLYDSDRRYLDSMVSLEEIKDAVWDCGSQKAPCPDVHYKIIAKILANRLSKVIDSIISPEQSAFISGRQILDGPLILSEVIDWYKKRKKKMMLFKVDFEKAFDSASLNSSRASILVNRSPTSEFSLKRLNKLSGWKANMLSSGGRLTLIKSVLGSLGIYYFSIFKASKAITKQLESLRASFFLGASGDKKKLAWIKWSNILASLDKGGSFSSFIQWPINGGRALADLNSLLMELGSITLSNKMTACCLILSHAQGGARVWISLLSCVRCVTILDRLPHRRNLSLQGLDIASIMCLLCNNHVESNAHVFFSCDIARDIWSLVRGWCDSKFPSLSSCDDWDVWNNVTFHSQVMRKCDISDNIRLFSFSWLKTRESSKNGSSPGYIVTVPSPKSVIALVRRRNDLPKITPGLTSSSSGLIMNFTK